MTEQLLWKVHTASLIKEVLNNTTTGTLVRPLQIFTDLLAQVAARASQLHDYELDCLMMRLTLYAVADPESPSYNQETVDKYLNNVKQ